MCRILLIACLLLSAARAVAADKGENTLESEAIAIGGVGGLYLLAEPGLLEIDIKKWDLHIRDTPTHLRAILVGPDRRPIDEVVLNDDGQSKGSGRGKEQHATLSAQVGQKGIYALNVTATHDRYGESVRWAYSTNCKKVLVETSRGHKDARHLEPIVLDSADLPGNICFAARSSEIEIEIDGLPSGVSPILFDDSDRQVAELTVDGDGRATHTISADDRSTERPWRLHLPSASATVHIDGVTRWERGEAYENLSLWSLDTESWFPFHDLRWMMAPYSRAFHAAPGDTHTVDFTLHNNSGTADSLSLGTPQSDLNVSLSSASVELAPDESKTVTATINIPDSASGTDTLTAEVTVTSRNHPDISTWSTIEARIGQAGQLTLEGPLVYLPYAHENEQFAYTPDYPNANQLYFNQDNRPFIRTDDGVHTLDSKTWTTLDTIDGERYRAITSKVAFAESGEVCLIGKSGDDTAYLYSGDGGKTYTATPIPKRDAPRQQWDIESFAGQNRPKGLAPILRASETGEYDPTNFWRHVNDLELFLPEMIDGRVVIGEPILLSTQAIGISSHSGIPSAIVSRDDRVHIIWGEATDPDGSEPGVPAFVATYDRTTSQLLGEKAFVGFGPPANDVHNTPSIVIDSEGYLHTLTGTHGQPFAYARSQEPNTAHAGFTEPELVEEELRSTYIGFVCDPDDTLHLVFRTWKTDGEYHPESHYANLAYKRKRKGGDWEPMKRLAVAPFTEYSIWYHRLTIDRKGRLFVSFDYWSTFWYYRVDHFGNTPGRGQAGGGGRRKTIMSADGGETWKLLETRDL
jgi:hypothetical protein